MVSIRVSLSGKDVLAACEYYAARRAMNEGRALSSKVDLRAQTQPWAEGDTALKGVEIWVETETIARAAAQEKGRRMMGAPRPFTPDTLAERWGCSGETVRAMIRRGDIPAFRVSTAGYRITAQAVEDYECASINSDTSTGDMSSCGTRTESDVAFVLTHIRPGKRSGKPAT